MRSRRLVTLLRATALVAVLIVAQTATLAHSQLDDSHPAAGDACVLCVGQSALGAGNITVPPELGLAAPALQRFADAVPAIGGRGTDSRFARGPPPAS